MKSCAQSAEARRKTKSAIRFMTGDFTTKRPKKTKKVRPLCGESLRVRTPRKVSNEKSEVAAIGGGVRERAIGSDFELVLAGAGRHIPLALHVRLGRLEAIYDGAVQRKSDRRRIRHQLVRHIEFDAQLRRAVLRRKNRRRLVDHPA